LCFKVFNNSQLSGGEASKDVLVQDFHPDIHLFVVGVFLSLTKCGGPSVGMPDGIPSFK
jgi:hypothetical protein